MKFYPADWRADEALRSCSIGARGLWVEMMALMHVAEPYGSLLVKGKRPDKKQLASLCGVPEKECAALLIELEGMAVFGRDHDGTIFSRRMRRDAEKAIKDKENGASGGNPDLKKGVNPPDNSDDKAQRLEASSRVNGMGNACAPASAFTEGSKKLAEAFWKSLGIDSPLGVPPEFSGADWRSIEWEAAGWTPDLISAEVRKVGPGKALKYYEKCFATAFAARQAPLPVVEIKQAEKITVTHGTSKTQSGGSLLGSIRRQLAEVEQEEADLALSGCTVLGISDRSIR